MGIFGDIATINGDFTVFESLSNKNPTKHCWYLLPGEHRIAPWNRIGMFLGIAMGRTKKISQLFTMNWLWVGNHVPVSECQCHHILSCHLGFKFIAICDPWCWYIYLHGWVILFGPMLVNILYMEHMGYDSGWETRRKTATQGQPGKQRGNT